MLIRGHEDVIRRGGSVAEIPLIEEFSVLVENLNAAVAAIVDIETALVIDRDAVHGIEIARPPLFAVNFSALTPGHQELSVLVKFHDARFLVAVGDKEGAVRKPGDVGLAAESFTRRTGLLNVGRAAGIASHLRVPLGGRVERADGL